MKHLSGVVPLIAVVLLAAGLAARQATPQATSSENAQVIELTAQKYHYTPDEIRVKKGTRVELRIRPVDRSHGFKVDLVPEGSGNGAAPGLVFAQPQAEHLKIEKDDVHVVQFVADRPGVYHFHCTHVCGFGHSRMKGKLVVEE